MGYYLPHVAWIVECMHKSSRVVEIWAIIEAVFYICLQLQVQYLQYQDPLEASLSAAPMFDQHERQTLWNYVMEVVQEDPISFLTGWFFDEKIENISKYDYRDFVTWSMFEGRNQEHLTQEEISQLNSFVDEMEWRISIYLYGIKTSTNSSDMSNQNNMKFKWDPDPNKRSQPTNEFKFGDSNHGEEPSFFTNLYESYKNRYDQYIQQMEKSDLMPSLDLSKYMTHKKNQIYEAEKHALTKANQIYDSAYFTFIEEGSDVDKQLTALGHATRVKLLNAWNSVFNIRDRIETATFLASRRRFLKQQLQGYRALLVNMRSMSSNVPARQMANVMRKITYCNEALHTIEGSAMSAFSKATGLSTNVLFESKKPCRYAKYSGDPVYNIDSYPLMFHFLMLAAFDGFLRILLKRRGFQRLNIGPICYYYHPGTKHMGERSNADSDEGITEIPFVFCHGIGVGFAPYLPLIDGLLKSGRPVFLPEIPYVTGFRPWQNLSNILTPVAVSGVLTTMLASHGFMKGTFIGHSYGTSWLSYMCKYAKSSIAGLVFLDPICFCLHLPKTTRTFVYNRCDPGSVSYMVRTDVIVNWTMQRCMPWQQVILFTEQIPENVSCAVFLCELDKLVATDKVTNYLRSKGAASIKDFTNIADRHFEQGPINVTIIRGKGHGDWAGDGLVQQVMAEAANIITAKGEKDNFKSLE